MTRIKDVTINEILASGENIYVVLNDGETFSPTDGCHLVFVREPLTAGGSTEYLVYGLDKCIREPLPDSA